MTRTAAGALVETLENQGVDRVFCVPGESYLDVLDALRDSSIHTVVARHEGAAAMMAEADGKLTGRPGIAFVTRGPGATNASAGVHVAQQDSTPLVLFAGQVARAAKGRDAFQELDFAAFFGGMAKSVVEVEDAETLPAEAESAFRARPASFLAATAARGERSAYVNSLHSTYLDWSKLPHASPGQLTMGHVMATLRQVEDPDMVLTNGAGNYSGWIHRFHRFRRFGTQVAATSGSMGYGLPAAIAAKLRHPERTVVCFAGDGCFQMTGQELATAAQLDAQVIVLVADNAMYGTIRMHQERAFPGRAHATSLANPDFAALARACGAYGERVERDEDFPAAFGRARQADAPALLHLAIDPEAITPAATLSSLGES